MLNKQSRTVDKCGPPAWGLGEELATPHLKNSLLRNVTQRFGFERFLWNALDSGKWIHLELGVLRVSIVASELAKCNLDLVAVQEVR